MRAGLSEDLKALLLPETAKLMTYMRLVRVLLLGRCGQLKEIEGCGSLIN